jgi:tetratricopeptide (TPR) repeat protein
MMHRLTKQTIAAASSVLLLAFAAHGQDVLWQTYFDAGNKAIEKGDLPEAEKQLKAALESASSLNNQQLQLIPILNSLGRVFEDEGKLPDAQKLYERSVSICGSENHLLLIAALNNLGIVLQKEGNYKDAEGKMQEAIALCEKSLAPSSQSTSIGSETQALAATCMNMAQLKQDTGDYAAEEVLLKRALDMYEKNAGSEPQTVECLHRLARLYAIERRYGEAEPLLVKVLNLTEQSKGGSAKKVAVILREQGAIYKNEGKYEDAERVLRQSIKTVEHEQSPLPDIADGLLGLAEIYRQQSKNTEAVQFCEKALELRKNAFGENSTKAAQAMSRLGLAYADADEYKKAESVLQQALQIDEHKFGEKHIEVAHDLNNCALVYLDQGKYDLAEPLYIRAVNIASTSLGPEHPETALSISNLAWLYYNQGNYAKAEPLLQKSLVIREKVFGKNHPYVAQSLSNLAAVYAVQNKIEKAEAFFQQAIKLDEASYGQDNPDLARNMRELSILYQNQERFSDAETLMRKLLSRDEKVFGLNNAMVASDLESLAAILKHLNHADEAAELRHRAASIKVNLPGGRINSTVVLNNQGPRGQTTPEAPAMAPNSLAPRGQTPEAPAMAPNSLAPRGETTPESPSLKVSDSKDPGKPIGDKWALVVGISNYRDSSINLRYAAKDATDFRNYLVQEAHFRPDHVRLLTDSEATRSNIVDYMGDSWLKRLASPNDLVVIYVSGHGSAVKHEASDTNFLVPYDCSLDNLILNGIPMQWLTSGLKHLVNCNRAILILDVCHSGAAAAPITLSMAEEKPSSQKASSEKPSSEKSPSEKAPSEKPSSEKASSSSPTSGGKSLPNSSAPTGEKNLKHVITSTEGKITAGDGQMVLASSGAEQVSWESKAYHNSVFTRRLIEGLRKDGDHTLVGNAFNYMKEKVEEEVLRDRSEVQTPILIGQWQGPDVTLGAIPESPRAGLDANPGAKAKNGRESSQSGSQSAAKTVNSTKSVKLESKLPEKK